MAAESTRLFNFSTRLPRLNDWTLVDGGAAMPIQKRPNVQMPDEYLPPNKILFLQNLPESVTKDQLMALFSQLRRWRTNSSLYVLTVALHQVPKSVRSSSDPHEEGYRFRGIHRRSQCKRREGRSTQLQAGWREQDQGTTRLRSEHIHTQRFLFR